MFIIHGSFLFFICDETESGFKKDILNISLGGELRKREAPRKEDKTHLEHRCGVHSVPESMKLLMVRRASLRES